MTTPSLGPTGTAPMKETEVAFVANQSDASGGVYSGRLVNNKRDGDGVLTWRRHGDGVWHRTDGGWFEGIYLDNKWKSGTWHDPDGAQTTYAESWVWNAETSSYQVQGRGVHRRKKVVGGDGVWDTVYDGDWAGGLMHGRGTLKSLETGEVYCGEFDHGVKSGMGTLHFRDREGFAGYDGHWLNGKFHGNGVYVWPSRDVYEGQWDCGIEHGRGKKTWAMDGSSFEGQWERGFPQNGVMKWPNGDMFDGLFREIGTQKPSGVLECYDGLALHKPGSSLPNYIHEQNMKNLLEEAQVLQENVKSCQNHMKELEEQKEDLIQQLSMANRNIQQLEEQLEQETRIKAYRNEEPFSEIQVAFDLATKFRSQVRQAAPQLESLEKAATQLRHCIQSAESRNKQLQVHVGALTDLKATLSEGIKYHNYKYHAVLRRNLTGWPEDTEAQRPTIDGRNLLDQQPWLQLQNLQEPFRTSVALSSSSTFAVLEELSDSLHQLQKCKFDECTKAMSDNTELLKECTSHVTKGKELENSIGQLYAECQSLNTEYQRTDSSLRTLQGIFAKSSKTTHGNTTNTSKGESAQPVPSSNPPLSKPGSVFTGNLVKEEALDPGQPQQPRAKLEVSSEQMFPPPFNPRPGDLLAGLTFPPHKNIPPVDDKALIHPVINTFS
ncbi:hypothetical protein Pelo_509 [Pelomyxa schiedti]|nr:hypothetical protein Pelo_509 [Pelomyxa schiedti]